MVVQQLELKQVKLRTWNFLEHEAVCYNDKADTLSLLGNQAHWAKQTVLLA